MVAELQANTLGATFCPLQPMSSVETLPDTCRGGFRDLLQDSEQLKVMPLVHRQADPIRQLKAKTSSDTLRD